jgi:hypothetical protein
MNNMVISELEKQAGHAIRERLSCFTVVVDVSTREEPIWGTGSLIKFNNRYFILTCRHVVTKEYPNEELGVLFYPGGTSKYSSKEKIKGMSLSELTKAVPNKSYRQKVNVINRFYSDVRDDLVLLELAPSSEQVSKNEFYDLSKHGIRFPEPNQGIYLTGFSEELARNLGGKKVGALPYFETTILSSKEVGLEDFDSQREYLVDYPTDEYSVEPRGLSGCGVWVRLPSGKDNIWTPNVYLAGVQKAVYRNSQVLVVTKAERILQLISG